jgi:hypothetical protein
MHTTRSDDFDEQTVEELMTGRYRGRRSDLRALAACLSVTRDELVKAPGPAPSADVAQIIHSGLATRRARRAAQRAAARRAMRRRGIMAGASTLLTTFAGKVLFGAVAVAAGVGGVHATGVVEVPGLPDRTVTDFPPVGRDASMDRSGGRPASDADVRVVVEIHPDPDEQSADERDVPADDADKADRTDEARDEPRERKKRFTWTFRDGDRWGDRDGRRGKFGGR